jgi:type II secretory pathway component PulK
MRHGIRMERGRRGITVLALVLLFVAVVIVAVLVSRSLGRSF